MAATFSHSAGAIPPGGAQPAAQLTSPDPLGRRGVRGWLYHHPYVNYAIQRVLLFFVTLWGALTLAFFFFRLIPGDPISAYVASLESSGAYGTQVGQEIIDHYKEAFGLQGNLFQQYVRYLQQVLISHDLGPALMNFPTPAQVLIVRALPWTVGLLGLSVIFSWCVGVVIGGLVAWRRNSRGSQFITNLAVTFSNVPNYFIALFLVFIFAYRLDWLPPTAAYDPHYDPGWNLDFIMSVIQHGTLPAASLVFIFLCRDTLSTRMLTVTTLGEDYLTYADAKGLPQRQILTQYALRNCILPQVTAVAIQLGFIFNGAVILERVFNYPGLGNLLIQAIGQLDYNTIQGIITFSIVGVLTANLIIDLMLPFIDPRIKVGQ